MKPRLLLARSIRLVFLLLLLSPYLSYAQSTINGKITDENGKGVAGVTVAVKGSTNQTISGDDGSYRISGVTSKDILVFTSIGYLEQEIAVKDQTVINLTMDISQKVLGDVVVIGYGTQKKRNVTGAVSQFDARKLEERPMQRVDQALVGQLSGVTVKQTT